MKTSSNKRFLALILALVLMLSVVPFHVLAVEYLNTTVLDGKIRISTDGVSGQGSAVDNQDGTITVTTVATANCNGGAYSYEATNHVVLITNNTADETLMVEFDYAATGLGTLTIEGEDKTINPTGTYSKSLAPGECVTVVVSSPATGADDVGDSASIVLSNFALKDTGEKTVTVLNTEGGAVTVDGATLADASTTLTVDYTTGVQLTATASDGYAFLGWVDGNMNVLSTTASYHLQPLVDVTVAAAFVADDAQGYWLAGGMIYTDLNEACAAAESGDKMVILLKSATLPAGNYTVPAGINVLIPFDEAKTRYGEEPELMPNGTAWVDPSPYCTLTMASGAKLVVNGTLELASRHHVSSGSSSVKWGGAIYGKFGHIDMAEGSEIQVNGTLYAWGIVSGEGEVIANAGGTVYEKMQIHDYRGGAMTSSLATTYAANKLFPFNQYYVQNVEVKETIHAGATLMVDVGVYLSAPEQTSIAFVGTRGAMFTLSEGAYVTKEYNEAEDRLQIDVYGNTGLSSIALEFEGNEVNSSSFRLGINNNIDIKVHSGVTTINQEMILQAGATVVVDREATLYNTTNLFVMDAEDWGTFARGVTIMPIKWSYANGTTVKRTSVTDAIVDVNGAVINAGQIFTSGSESIISSGKTGVYALLNPAVSGSTVYQLDHNDINSIETDWVTIDFTAAVLVNGDQTAVSAEGALYDAYIYDSCLNQWVQKNIFNEGTGHVATVTYDANGGAGSVEGTTVDYFGIASGFLASDCTAIDMFSFAAAANGFNREGYTFIGWSSDSAATEAQVTPGQYIAIADDTTLYAIWDAETFTLTIDGVGQDVACGTDLSTLITEPSMEGFTFACWTVTKADGTVIDAPATMPAYDVTFTANWEAIPVYTLTFLDENGDVIASGEFYADAAITAPSYAPEGYNFLGWLNTATGTVEAVPAVMPACDLEYQASIELITYTVSFVDGTAEIGEVTVNYGESATLLDALSRDGSVFQGWGETADAVTYAAGETISISSDLTLYAVWHDHSYEAVVTAPTCVEDGYTTYTCACGDSYVADEVAATGHSFANGSCTVCGEADPDYVKPSVKPTLGLKYPSLSFEDVIIMNVYYSVANTQDVVEMGLITYKEKPATYGVETADAVIPGYGVEGGLCYSSTEGIAPKDIGDTIYFAVYAELADGTYVYTSLIGYSPKTYAANMLKTSTTEMKTLVVAMLNYGSAAQNYFSYKVDSLVNADMTDEQKALVAAYSADMIAAVTQPGTKAGALVSNGGHSNFYPTISFEGAFCINYYFKPKYTPKGDVTMYIWTLEDFNAVDVMTKENASRAVPMTLTESGEYLAVVDGIAAKDLDKAVYVSVCYSNGTTDYCSGTIGYTIGLYCKGQAARTGTLADLAAACAVYGYYAKQLFG